MEVKLPEQGRIYDGTDQIELNYEVEGLEPEAGWRLQYRAWLEGTDVGEWPVQYEFWLEKESSADFGDGAENGEEMYQLLVEDQSLTAAILPKTLSVTLPDGWKEYGKTAEMKNIHLSGRVSVTGFIQDEEGNEVIPEEFEPPKVAVDTAVVGQWSDIYEGEIQKVYQGALVMKRRKNGKLTGNPTPNYVFSEEEEAYRKGNLVIAQSAIAEGVDYEIAGEPGAFCRNQDGMIWIRQGSGLTVSPVENRGYTEGWFSGPLSQSGTSSFCLKKRNNRGQVTADSLEGCVSFEVDGEVPAAAVEVLGVSETEGTCYGKENVSVRIRIPEDAGSGIKQARYFMAVSQEALPEQIPENQEWWQDCTGGAQISLTRTGTYIIYVETEDRTGNKAYAKSSTIVVDLEKPEIFIEGVEQNSANRGRVCLTIRCSDDYYRSGSLNVKITGANGSYVPVRKEIQSDHRGELFRFEDFAHEKNADDIYTVTALAEDLAGNRSEKAVTFSVNRFGSVYDLDTETKDMLRKFYHKRGFPVIFREINLDYVGAVQILCRREGSMTRLKENQDYFVSYSGTETGWKQYTYTIPAEFFVKEGSYEVMMISRDRAQNSGDSQSQRKAVRFAVDASAPECLITGVEPNQIYQGEARWICLEPRDNLCLKEMTVYQDGKKTAVYSKGEIQEQAGVIKWQVTEKEDWQRLEVRVVDEAGNESWTEELPFYLTSKEDREKILPYIKSEKTAKERDTEAQRLAALKRKQEKLGIVGVLRSKQKERSVTDTENKAAAGLRQLEAWKDRIDGSGFPQQQEEYASGSLWYDRMCRVLFWLMGGLFLTAVFLTVGMRRLKRKG